MTTQPRPRQLRRVLNATDPTANIIIPAESMFTFNGSSADLAQQFYQRYQAGDAVKKLAIAHNKLPAVVQQRLKRYELKFKNLHSLLQRALLWDSGYVLDGSSKDLKLVKIYTANGTSMADIAVSYDEFTGSAGCSASNCSSSAAASRAITASECSGDKLARVLKCVSDDVGTSKGLESSSSSAAAFWATGGDRRAIPELSIVQHTWQGDAGVSFSVNAIHSIALSDEQLVSEDCSASTSRSPSMIIPCARFSEFASSSTGATYAEPAPGKLVDVWLEHAHADRPGFSTYYTVLIVVAVIAGLVLLITLGCKGKSRFKKRKQRREEAKMTSADPQAFLNGSSEADEEALEASAVALTPVHAILEADLESPSSNSSEWTNVFVSQTAVAGKRLRMDQLALKKLIAKSEASSSTVSEVWAAKYHNVRVVVKKQTMVKREVAAAAASSKPKSFLPEFSAEIELLASLRHRNIVRFYGVAWDSPDSLCVITEYARKGNLQDALSPTTAQQQQPCSESEPAAATVSLLTWPQIERIMTGVVKALQYLHTRDQPVVHGDLCARNVLLSSHFEPKLIGVGAARRCESSDDQQAPSVESDIYALGVLLGELITYSDARHLRKTEVEEHKQESEDVERSSLWCSQAIRDVAAQCVTANPGARPDLSEILKTLSAPHSQQK